MGKNGKQIARESVIRLKELIAEREAKSDYLPLHDGGDALHLGNICHLVGVLRTTVNTNADFRNLLKDYAARHGLKYSIKGQIAKEEEAPEVKQSIEPMVPAAKLRDVSQRLAKADRKNAELIAENASLRSQLMRRDEVAELIALGGRINPAELDI